MILFNKITTSANVTKQNPLVTDFKVTKGFIYKFILVFPPGSTTLLGVQVFHGQNQIYPLNLGQWFIGDNVTYEFEDTYNISVEPYNLFVHTYNDDETFEHSCFIGLGLESSDIFIQRYIPDTKLSTYLDLLITKEQKQSETNRAIIQNAVNNYGG